MKFQAEKDERAVVIEKSGSHIAYMFMSFALLLNVMYRAYMLGESSFDLLAIIVISGIISTIYQAKHKTINKSWIKPAILVISVSIIVAFIIATIIK